MIYYISLSFVRAHSFTRTFCSSQCLLQNVRVRFAPSPTGMMHLGGMRTALYNYLFAKSQNGKFLLRIEDTDQTRLVPGATEKLVEMLQWIGLSPDEGPYQGGDFGPYVQSERRTLYLDQIKVLLENGNAYHCFCTERRLDLLRKEAVRRREIVKYDNRCRHLTTEQVQEKMAAGIPYVIRFKLKPVTDPWDDLVMGPVLYNVAEAEGDPVLIKSDSFPTYHFANVVDDHHMKISHILRGQEWKMSTTKHILIYEAFGWTPPKFGHLPLLLNSDGTKLSKRQHAATVEHYKQGGYIPDAVLNSVTYLGGGFVDETAGLTLAELTEKFDVSRLRKNSGVLEMQRIDEFNRLHLIRRLSSNVEELIGEVRKLVTSSYKNCTEELLMDEQYMQRCLEWLLDSQRIYILKDIVNPDFKYLWIIPTKMSLEQFSNIGCDTMKALHDTVDYLDILPTSQYSLQGGIGKLIKDFAAEKQYKYGPYMKLLRNLLGGPDRGPSVAEMVSVLGKEQAIHRLKVHFNKDDTESR